MFESPDSSESSLSPDSPDSPLSSQSPDSSLSPLSSDDPLSSDSTVVPEPLFPSLSSTLVVAACVKRNNFGKLTPGRCFGQKTMVVELFHLAHPYFGMTFS